MEFYVKDFEDMKPFYGKIILTDEPEESIIIATPFNKKAHFYFNQKINCIRAEGRVNYKGSDYIFKKEESFGVLDWGRLRIGK